MAFTSIPDVAFVEFEAVFAQQFAVLLLECPRAMMLWLLIYIFQHGFELTGAHRKRAISALPEKAAIPSVKRFDPFRGCFLYLFDELSLGNDSRQRCDNVNVIRDTADAHEFGTQVATECGQISMYARSHIAIQPRFAILGAEDDVKDDFTE
jgi:hypothetical protein